MNLFDQNDEELKKQILLRSLIGGDETSYSKPMIGNEQTAHVARGLSNAADLFVGRKPQFPVGGNSKLAEAMAMAQFKDSLEDPVDKALKQDYLRARTQNAERGPFWASQPGQAYYDARTSQAKSQGEQAATETGLMKDFQDKVQSGGAIPPGTTQQAGPYNIPLNPVLTDTAQGAIAGADKFEPLVARVKELVGGGALNNGKSRTYTQFLAEGGGSPIRRLLTKDDSILEELASARQELFKLAFTEGGKTLSPTELPIVKAGLDFFGKGDAQIISDFEKAMAILRSKKQLALGGRNAALGGGQQTQQKPSGVDRQSLEAELAQINAQLGQ